MSGDFGELGDAGSAAAAGAGVEVTLNPENVKGVVVLGAARLLCDEAGLIPWKVKLVEPNDGNVLLLAASTGVLELAWNVGKPGLAGVDVDDGAVWVRFGKRLPVAEAEVVATVEGWVDFAAPKLKVLVPPADVVARGILNPPNVAVCFGTKPPEGAGVVWLAGVAVTAAAAGVVVAGVEEKPAPPKLNGLLPTDPNENPPVALILNPESNVVVAAGLGMDDGIAPGRGLSQDKQLVLSDGFLT